MRAIKTHGVKLLHIVLISPFVILYRIGEWAEKTGMKLQRKLPRL